MQGWRSLVWDGALPQSSGGAAAITTVHVLFAVMVIIAVWVTGSVRSGKTAESAPPQVALYAIHPKHQKSVKNNILSGITLGCWVSLLYRRAGVIEWACYWPRICFLSFMACLNSTVGCIEWALYSRAWRAQPLPKAPVFILGHPRTGTTLLHNMLSRDKESFIYCSAQHICSDDAHACTITAMQLRTSRQVQRWQAFIWIEVHCCAGIDCRYISSRISEHIFVSGAIQASACTNARPDKTHGQHGIGLRLAPGGRTGNQRAVRKVSPLPPASSPASIVLIGLPLYVTPLLCIVVAQSSDFGSPCVIRVFTLTLLQEESHHTCRLSSCPSIENIGSTFRFFRQLSLRRGGDG